MKYQLKNLKTMQGREGLAFSATLYRDGVLVAHVRDDGNGGMVSIDCDNWQAKQALEKELATWHRANCGQDYSRGYPSSGEAGINLIYAITEKNKKAKTNIVFQEGDDLAAMSLPALKKYLQEGKHFDGVKEYMIRKATIADKATLARLAKETPGARVWDPSVEKYRPIAELLK